MGGIFLADFFGRNFLGGFFWEDFFGRTFRRIFWEDFFGRNSLFTLLKSAKLFEYFVFVKILSKSKEGRKENFNP